MYCPVSMKTTTLLLALALTSVVAADHLERLRLICSGYKKVELARASDLPHLLSAAESHPEEAVCSRTIRQALVELDQLINKSKDNLCSPVHIERIRAFYKTFVDQKSIDEQQQKKLPRPVRRFFLSYGFGVSRVCKTTLLSSLTDARKMLDTADLDRISSLTSDNSSLAKIVKKPKDVDDIVLPSELAALMSEKNRTNADDSAGQEVKTSIVLQPKAAQALKKIQSICVRKFEPIYGQLVLPLVSLSRIGLNYRSDELSYHREQFKSDTDIHQWYRIVYLCELVRMVEVFEESKESEEADEAIEDADKKVRVLTSDEANDMRKSQPAGEILGDKLDYQLPTGHELGDLIVNRQDKRMRQLVSKFNVHKSELRRMRSKLVAQTLTITKQLLKQSKVKLAGSLLKKGSLNDQLDKMANDYMRQLSEPENAPEEGHVIMKRNCFAERPKLVIFIAGLVCFLLCSAVIVYIFGFSG